jgi:hypothetical protein
VVDLKKQNDSKINRNFETEIFINANKYLESLVRNINSSNKGPKWNMQFRGNVGNRNNVDLYCNGNKLTIKFYQNLKKFSVTVNKTLLNRMDPNAQQIIGKPIELNDKNFMKLLKLLPVIKQVFTPSSQKERILECDLANSLCVADKFFVADIEVVASKTVDYKVNGIKKSHERNSEGDMLVLYKVENGYRFLPIEMKRVGADLKVLKEASNEIRTFLNVIYGAFPNKVEGLFNDFKSNYEIICKDKISINLLIKNNKEPVEIINDSKIKMGMILYLVESPTNPDNTLKIGIENMNELKPVYDGECCILSLKCTKEYFIHGEWLSKLPF